MPKRNEGSRSIETSKHIQRMLLDDEVIFDSSLSMDRQERVLIIGLFVRVQAAEYNPRWPQVKHTLPLRERTWRVMTRMFVSVEEESGEIASSIFIIRNSKEKNNN